MSEEDKDPTVSRVEGSAERQPVTTSEIDDFIRDLRADTEAKRQQIIDILTRVKDSLPIPAQNFPEEERLGERPVPIVQSPTGDIEQATTPAEAPATVDYSLSPGWPQPISSQPLGTDPDYATAEQLAATSTLDEGGVWRPNEDQSKPIEMPAESFSKPIEVPPASLSEPIEMPPEDKINTEDPQGPEKETAWNSTDPRNIGLSLGGEDSMH